MPTVSSQPVCTSPFLVEPLFRLAAFLALASLFSCLRKGTMSGVSMGGGVVSVCVARCRGFVEKLRNGVNGGHLARRCELDSCDLHVVAVCRPAVAAIAGRRKALPT